MTTLIPTIEKQKNPVDIVKTIVAIAAAIATTLTTVTKCISDCADAVSKVKDAAKTDSLSIPETQESDPRV